MDATRWNAPWLLSGQGSGEPDKLPPEGRVPEAESTPHMKNWFECMRSRKTPAAPIDAGLGHAVACIMADESFVRGRRMTYDPVKRAIAEG